MMKTPKMTKTPGHEYSSEMIFIRVCVLHERSFSIGRVDSSITDLPVACLGSVHTEGGYFPPKQENTGGMTSYKNYGN